MNEELEAALALVLGLKPVARNVDNDAVCNWHRGTADFVAAITTEVTTVEFYHLGRSVCVVDVRPVAKLGCGDVFRLTNFPELIYYMIEEGALLAPME